MYVDQELLSEYRQIILQENNRLIKEEYWQFKGRAWLTQRDTLPATLSISGKTYEETKGKQKIVYQSYAACDPTVNRIRNNAFYWKMEHVIDSVVRNTIGHTNDALTAYRSRINGTLMTESVFFKAYCHSEFQEKVQVLHQKELAFIDSVYNAKVKRAALVSSNPAIIDYAFINDFLNTFNETDPDLRTLERIMVQQPEMLLTAVDRIYPETSYVFIWKLDEFPKDLDLTAAKTALKQTQQRNPLKRKVIRKMKNKIKA